MRTRRPVLAVAVLAAGTAMLTSGCSAKRAAADEAGSSPTGSGRSTANTDARGQLAGLAAAAKDRRMVAGYVLTRTNQPTRTLTVTLAADGTWRIDMPGGALGGAADIAIVGAQGNLYQCPISIAGTRTTPSCVRIAGLDTVPPVSVDPRVQHPFTDWLDVLTDRRSAVSVAAAKAPTGAGGSCFSVDSNSASLAPQMDAGIYCYEPDGTLTAARTASGTLLLTGKPAPAPKTIQMPGPVVSGIPLPTTSPVAPSASAGSPSIPPRR